jgi:ParB/RepB/Spo0J family partition protein
MPSVTHPASEQVAAPGLPLGPLPIATKEAAFEVAPIDKLRPSPFNPRGEDSFVKAELEELADTYKQVGLLQPILVRQVGSHLEIMGGERRWRAAKIAKLGEVPVIVRKGVSDDEARVAQLVENGQRKDLTPMEEANYYAALQKAEPKKWTAAAIGRLIGKSDRYVAQRISIATNLAAPFRKAMSDGALSFEQARTLAVFPPGVQTEVDDWAIRRGADEIRRVGFERCIPVTAAKFDLSLYQGDFIEDGKKKRFFADIEQFRKLQRAAAEKKLKEVRKDWPKAELVEPADAEKWHWADTQYPGDYTRVTRSQRAGDVPAKYLVPKDKCSAIVWIAANGEIRKALGVCSIQALQAAERSRSQRRESSSSRSSPRASRSDEPREHKKAREAFNAELRKAAARAKGFDCRLALFMAFADVYAIDTPSPTEMKAAAPPALRPFVNVGGNEAKEAKLWEAIARQPIAQVEQTLAALWTSDLPTWEELERWEECPPVVRAIAATLGVKVPDVPGTVKAPAKTAKAVAKVKAKAKTRKHG